MAAALLFLAAYAAPVVEPELPSGVVRAASWVVTAVVALPLLRPLRLLRLLTLLSFVNRRATSSLRGQVIAYVAGLTSLVLLLASLAVLDAERGREGANIEDFGDPLWWSATTVTTVGYGDRFPVTGTGRFIAVALMLAGIALLGVVTAGFASWLIERVAEEEERRGRQSRGATWRRSPPRSPPCGPSCAGRGGGTSGSLAAPSGSFRAGSVVSESS